MYPEGHNIPIASPGFKYGGIIIKIIIL